MRVLSLVVCALVLSVPAVASAQAKAKGYGCDSINFSKDVLDRMPNAQKLCRGVTEREGGVYVAYLAEVVSKTDKSVTVDFKDKDNKPVSRVEFAPTMDQTVRMGGKDVKYSSLKKGDQLDFYIEHNRWGLFASPQGQPMTIMHVQQLPQ